MKACICVGLAMAMLFAVSAHAEDFGGGDYQISDSEQCCEPSCGPFWRPVGGAELLFLKPSLPNGEAFMVGSANGNVRRERFGL
jgi:hypothetical protein